MTYLSSYGNLFSFSGGATRSGFGGSRAQGHLEKALAEVDGLFAGFVYLDTTEPKHTCTSPNANGPRDGLVQELQALCDEYPINEAAGSSPCGMNSDTRAREIAWSSIRTVRDGMEAIWGHFVDVAVLLDNAVINNILTDYQDAKGLRQIGAIAFRNTLSGPAPNDLCKIFAFCSLSYVVSRLLYARNRIAEGDILAGVRLWLDALERQDEREAFKLLAEHLWPEARNHLHFIDFGLGEQPQRLATNLRRGLLPTFAPPTHTQTDSPFVTMVWPQSPPRCNFSDPHINEEQDTSDSKPPIQCGSIDPSLVNLQTTGAPPLYLQNLTQLTHEEFNFSHGLSAPPVSDQALPSASWEDFDPGPSLSVDLDMTSTEDQQFNIPEVPTQLPITDDPLRPSLRDGLSCSSTRADPDALNELQETSVFRTVMQYVRENACFWYNLAGRGLVSKDSRSCLAWGQEKLPRKMHIQKSFIQPLSSEKNKRDMVSRGIVAIAEAFVERGLLQDREDTEFYMALAGSVRKTEEDTKSGSLLTTCSCCSTIKRHFEGSVIGSATLIRAQTRLLLQ